MNNTVNGNRNTWLYNIYPEINLCLASESNDSISSTEGNKTHMEVEDKQSPVPLEQLDNSRQQSVGGSQGQSQRNDNQQGVPGQGPLNGVTAEWLEVVGNSSERNEGNIASTIRTVCLGLMNTCIWVRSRNCVCRITWFCYKLIAKPGNTTEPQFRDLTHIYIYIYIYIYICIYVYMYV